MNRRADYDYWDPYKDDKSTSRNRISPTYHYQNTLKRLSNQKNIGNIIINSSGSRQRKKIFQVKSTSKDKRFNDENKPKMFVISDSYFLDKKQDRSKSPSSYLEYNNKKLNVIDQVINSSSSVKKPPIRIIKKSPPKKQARIEPQQMAINTTVTAPSSIATSVLNNFETNPDRLLGNMTESKLDKVFKF